MINETSEISPEVLKLFEKLEKKIDKLLNLNTKIAKTLHLVPVTEKEERAIQIMRERNAQQAYKVDEERRDLKNEEDTDIPAPSLETFQQMSIQDIYADVLTDDMFPKGD
ncbi:MAG: hypothetical protein J6R62_04220 [Rikenellaceae bacterium]|nr:hypothetical protein [Rikenellaceae bacterium]